MENTAKLKSSVAWSDFKLNSDGMVPVIAQDYQTNEVLMLAYMNEEAFNTNDTILAKVEQIGAACHTGNRTCFFKTLTEAE